jgi:NADPH-dependent glutamate synthase beta subunit-like oxidoreductase
MAASPGQLRVAIVGSGPAGFYAAEHLQKKLPTVEIDMFDRLPTPYGLVRGGVAPDHPKIKSVTRMYERIAAHPGFRFLGNVRVGAPSIIQSCTYSTTQSSTLGRADRSAPWYPGGGARGQPRRH